MIWIAGLLAFLSVVWVVRALFVSMDRDVQRATESEDYFRHTKDWDL